MCIAKVSLIVSSSKNKRQTKEKNPFYTKFLNDAHFYGLLNYSYTSFMQAMSPVNQPVSDYRNKYSLFCCLLDIGRASWGSSGCTKQDTPATLRTGKAAVEELNSIHKNMF